jgi:hypothetical protein
MEDELDESSTQTTADGSLYLIMRHLFASPYQHVLAFFVLPCRAVPKLSWGPHLSRRSLSPSSMMHVTSPS